MRIVSIIYDVLNGVLLDADGTNLRSGFYKRVYYNEHPLLQIRLVNGNPNTPSSLFTGEYQFAGVLDKDFTKSTTDASPTPGVDALMALSLDDEINIPGDWVNGQTADPTKGEFSVRLHCNRDSFLTKLNNAESLSSCFFELQALNAIDDRLEAVVRFPLPCYNILAVLSNYRESGVQDAILIEDAMNLFALQNPQGGNYRIKEKKWYQGVNPDTGLFQSLFVKGALGEERIGFSEGEP